jgi:molecular chaperone HscA
LRSGVEQSIEVKPQYGLSDEEVERMLLESITHAKEDINTRALVEAKTEAEQLIFTTLNFIKKNKSLLSEAELAETEGAVSQLQRLLNGNDKDGIHGAIENLNEISRPYAERIMDTAIGVAMKGKKI